MLKTLDYLFNYSGPSEGSPSYKMGLLFLFLFVCLFGHRMKKKCEVFDRIEFQDYSADKGKQTTHRTQVDLNLSFESNCRS